MVEIPQSKGPAADEPPPVLGSWSRVYTVVLLYLAVLITLFYVFSRAYSA